jgi:hypothetical protein
MPFARAAVRQTGGSTPLGLVEKRMKTAIGSMQRLKACKFSARFDLLSMTK